MFIISEETVSQNNQTASTVSQTSMFIISEETVSQNNQTASTVSQTSMFMISEGTVNQNNQTASTVSQTSMFIISEETVSQNNQTASTVSQTPMFIISEETVSQNNQTASTVSQTSMFMISEGTVNQNNQTASTVSQASMFIISEGTVSQNNQTASMVSQTPMFIISEGTVSQNNRRQLPLYLKLLCLLFQKEQSIRTIRDSFHCISNFYVYYFRQNSQSEQSETASTVSQTSMFIISDRTVGQNNQRQLPRYLKLLCLLFQNFRRNSQSEQSDSFHGISNSYVYYFRRNSQSEQSETASTVSQTSMFIISDGTVSQNNRRQLPLYLKLLCLLFQKEQSIRTIRDSFHCISNFYVYYFRRNSQSEQSETASTVSQSSMFIISEGTVNQNNQRQLPRYLKLPMIHQILILEVWIRKFPTLYRLIQQAHQMAPIVLNPSLPQVKVILNRSLMKVRDGRYCWIMFCPNEIKIMIFCPN